MLTEELLRRIDALAAKLGTTGEHIWKVLAGQARAEAVASLLIGGFLFAFSGALMYVGAVLFLSEISTASSPWGIGPLALSLIVLCFALDWLYAVRWFFAPEAWALERIVRVFKGEG